MRNLLALIGLFVVVFGGVGWYCGWYKLSVTRNQEGKLEIKTAVDTHKVTDDSSAFFQKVGQMVADKANAQVQPVSAPGNTPGPITPVDSIAPVAPAAPPAPPPTNDGRSGSIFNGSWMLPPFKPHTKGH